MAVSSCGPITSRVNWTEQLNKKHHGPVVGEVELCKKREDCWVLLMAPKQVWTMGKKQVLYKDQARGWIEIQKKLAEAVTVTWTEARKVRGTLYLLN